MNIAEDGGSAFPQPFVAVAAGDSTTLEVPCPDPSLPAGMSLRDWFAGQAIALFPLGRDELDRMTSGESTPDHEFVAKFCYDLADAMIKERSKTKVTP